MFTIATKEDRNEFAPRGWRRLNLQDRKLSDAKTGVEMKTPWGKKPDLLVGALFALESRKGVALMVLRNQVICRQ